tara:strand:- start:3597 stop:4607 length:1011 start_codon:yes stop_codon:yes gene_type:complete
MKTLKNKKIMITGGTGSFGQAVLNRLMDSDLDQILIFSRDEKKQEDIRRAYKSDKLNFYIGDVRDRDSLVSASRGIDYIFHAAALKQVPSCEFFPLEAVKTNILGTENVLEAAIQNSVKKVVCLSTDKAVYPINAMGISKAMMEKVLVAKSRNSNETVISATRYGNVLGSRGSVLPLFLEQITRNIPITITDPNMTRFAMSLDEAVELVMYAFEEGKNGDIFVQKAPACSIQTLSDVCLEIVNRPDHPVKNIGTRHGEKLYETLCSKEEMFVAEDLEKYYRIPSDNRDLNYEDFFEQGQVEVAMIEDFNSHNALQLNKAELKEILLKEELFRDYLK